MAKYVPKEKMTSAPLVIPSGSKGALIAIGATVVRAAKPPIRPAVTIREATAKEYEWLYNNGYSEYIDKVEEPKTTKKEEPTEETKKESDKTE